jgi:deoxyribonuclease-4
MAGSFPEGIRFGPAGIPVQCDGTSTADGIRCCRELGLGAMEMEFVRGVRMDDKAAEEAGRMARELDVSLSSHAPYYINFCSKEEEKMANSRRHLFQAARATHLAGGRVTVFHPGFYQKLAPAEAYAIAKRELAALSERLAQHGIRTVLGAETVGKKSAFGSLKENIKLAQEVERVEPVLDFSHLLARGDFPCRGADDYRKLLAMVERELPGWQRHMHCHFSEINYGEKGELNHLPLGERNEPPFGPLMEVLAENGYCGTVICESPKLDIDALLMQKEYAARRGGG